MKTRNIIVGLLAMTLMASSCQKSFLEVEPTDNITNKRLEDLSKNFPAAAEKLQSGQLNGLYAWMYTSGSGGTNAHYDFGQKNLDLTLDHLSGDLVCASGMDYNWYAKLQSYIFNRTSSSDYAFSIWRYLYRMVYTANGIIESAGPIDENSQDPAEIKKRYSVGQALAVRGHAYFYLTQFYAKEYEADKKLVPLYVNTKTVNKEKATQKQICDQVISDLTTAGRYLQGFERIGKFQANADVAHSYLAYMYGYLGKWDQVEKYSKMVKDNTAYKPMSAEEIVYSEVRDPQGNLIKTTGTGFADINIAGWIWGTDLTADMGIDLLSFWGQVDIFSFSYATVGVPRIMEDLLYNRIHQDDVRKGQFFSIPDNGPEYTNVPANKFYAPARQWQKQNPMTTDYVYLRVSEMYLLHIEALAMLKKDDEAKTELKKFLDGRIKDLSYIDKLNHDELVDEILFQTRVEFWGEGRSLLAFKRLHKNLELGNLRFDTNNRGRKIAWNDEILTFVIPEDELINNPNLDK